MTNFNEAFNILMKLEFNNPKNALHVNRGETGMTFRGIYQTYHKKWNGWERIYEILNKHNFNIERASIEAFNDDDLTKKVYDFYYANFWKNYKLERILSNKIANEIFIFGVNAGMEIAIKKAQELVGVVADGKIGNLTLNALNSYDEDLFDVEYDLKENEHYAHLIDKNPKLVINHKGWNNRAEYV